MTPSQLIFFALALQIIHFLGTWKLYVSAGFKAWQAAVPIYNAVILMKIIKVITNVGLKKACYNL